MSNSEVSDQQPQTASEKAKAREAQRQQRVAQYPYVALTGLASGIHPSTSRLITVDAVTFDEDGEIGEDFHAVLNPGPNVDPGPFHMHGLTHEEVREGRKFAQVLRALGRLLDDRTLVVHNGPQTWGFVVSEARKAMNAAARANRSRNRGRGGGRRRHRVGHVPRPEQIVDTLETARRQARPLGDLRVAAVASVYGIDAPSPRASVERAQRPADEVVREETLLLKELFLTQRDGPLAVCGPKEVRADRFGLQRAHVRVDAMEAARPLPNPGRYEPGKTLVRGMEVVVAPEIKKDPNILIEALMEKELVYSEKLTRETSLVVCNRDPQVRELDGKSMHAHRKGIPLLTDEEFLAALEQVTDNPLPPR